MSAIPTILRTSLSAAIALGILAFAPADTAATEAAWARITNGGYTILLQHAETIGGDGPEVDPEDCSTQANLSDRGRTQARRQGTRFAARAIAISAIYTSNYCRTQETAELAFGSIQAEVIPELDPLGAGDSGEEEQLAALVARIDAFKGPGNQLMITHAENIRALTGTYARDGEAIILAPTPEDSSTPDVVGRILLN